MIISISEDGGVTIFDNAEDARRGYEGVDVESGVVSFYDASGQYLAPVFTTPNTFGSFSIASGEYVLQPGPLPDNVDPLPLVLSEATYLAPNDHILSLDELRRRYPLGPSN